MDFGFEEIEIEGFIKKIVSKVKELAIQDFRKMDSQEYIHRMRLMFDEEPYKGNLYKVEIYLKKVSGKIIESKKPRCWVKEGVRPPDDPVYLKPI